MQILCPDGFFDYELLDSGDGEKLERFGQFTIIRPDPQIIWAKKSPNFWKNVDAIFRRTREDRGVWEKKSNIPDQWLMNWKGIKFFARLTPFKHTGIFPEQAVNWEWLEKRVSGKVLNLFGYTGIASLVCAKAGARVTHVDASRPTIGWAKENQKVSGLSDLPIRWILDDALEFVKREGRRGSFYDGIIMDPPAFGHTPEGKIWQFNRHLPELLFECKKILTNKLNFILINAYAVSTSAITLKNILEDLNLGGKVDYGELALKEKTHGRLLSTGIWGRWEGI